jgi:hypothetical protein
METPPKRARPPGTNPQFQEMVIFILVYLAPLPVAFFYLFLRHRRILEKPLPPERDKPIITWQ